jgi:large subunit ribosomal protein L4
MVKVDLYTAKGIKKGNFNLPGGFSEKANMKLLAQAIRVYEDRLHPGLSKVKTRGEIALSTRKIYRQKGTGGARHGAKSAPIFVGGGVAHGPKGIKRELSLPSKMRRKALRVALGIKIKGGNLAVVDLLSSLKKTKEAKDLLEKIRDGKNLKFTFVLSAENKDKILILRNIENIKVIGFSNLNAYQVFNGGLILMDKEIFAVSKKKTDGTTKTKKVVKKQTK